MTRQYSISDYPHPSVAADLAILAVGGGVLQVLLTRRDDAETVGGGWALPGGFVHIDEPPEETAIRVMQQKTGLRNAHQEQLATYGAIDRDPRGRVISIVYLTLVPQQDLLVAVRRSKDQIPARIRVPRDGETDGPVTVIDDDGIPLELAFDHAAILGDVVRRLRGKLDYSAVGFALLPRRFTLRQVQDVHEAILGRPLTTPPFRRKLLDRGMIRPTGEFEKGRTHRPAELYELKTRTKE